MTTVLVAAASAVVRAGLEAILKAGPALVLVGSSPLVDLEGQIERLQPDVVLIEQERGDTGPVLALPALETTSGPPAIVLLTNLPDTTSITEALRLGARAVLPREADSREIVAAVEAAAAGLLVLHPNSAESLLPMLSSTGRSAAVTPIEALTPRELEVLAMLAEGAGNKIIARRLGISEHTVKFHVGSIMAKLNASSRTEAVTIGVRNGLIML